MKFKNDILIIYSEEEGKAVEGWIQEFKTSLEKFMSHVMKRDCSIRILSSTKVKSENDLTDHAIIIPAITDDFIESKSCVFALEEFIDQSKNDVKTNLKGYDRIFNVCLEPFDRNLMPSKIIENHLYKFYSKDLLTDEIITFLPGRTEEKGRDERFWFKLTDLVYDLKEVLDQINSLGMTGGVEQVARVKTVYLAETAEDLDFDRDFLKRDLLRHGYRVLPEKSLDLNDKIVEERIKKDMEQADLTIHMIGNEYGRIPSGMEVSIVELQNNIATEHSNSVINQVKDSGNIRRFHKVIWINADPQEMTIKQKNYIDGVLKQAESMVNTEIIDAPIEELRNTVRRKLKYGHREIITQELPSESQSAKRSIYIISNPAKDNKSKDLANILEKEGYEAHLSPREGEIVDLIGKHQKNINECDATIILYDDESSSWLDSKIKDIIKAPGLGKGSPSVANGILNLGDLQISNKHLDQARMVLISDKEEISTEKLGPFLAKFDKQ